MLARRTVTKMLQFGITGAKTCCGRRRRGVAPSSTVRPDARGEEISRRAVRRPGCCCAHALGVGRARVTRHGRSRAGERRRCHYATTRYPDPPGAPQPLRARLAAAGIARAARLAPGG